MNQLTPQARVSVLAALRALVPERALTYAEAERIAELQANRLRELLGLTEPRLPEEAISDVPRIYVRREFGLPVSGLTHWENGRWVITLNASEPAGRQRFSLAHEAAHIINHTTQRWLCPPVSDNNERAERLADWFAGCLLAPKRHVKRLHGEGFGTSALAKQFGLTLRAMQVRLAQLGLSEPIPRCDWTARRESRTYFRASSVPVEVAV